MPASLNGKGIAAIALNGSTTIKGASGRPSDALVIQSTSSGGETTWNDGYTRRAGITYYEGTLNIENVAITMNDTSGSNFLGHSTAIYDNADGKLTVQNAALNTTNTQHGIYMNYGSASLKDTVFNVQNTSVANSSGVNLGPDTVNVMENCSGTIGAEYAIYTYGALTISGGSQTKLILNGASDGIVVKKSSEASGAGSVTYSGMNMEIHAPGGIDIENSSKFTLNSGKITAYVSGKGVTVLDADAQFILNNGTLEVNGSGDSAVGIQSKGMVSISGGAFHTSSVSAALQQAGTKEIVISGGTHTWTATVAGYGSHSSGGLKLSESADVTVNAPSGIQLLKDTKGGLEITGGSVKLNCTSVGIYSESGAGKTTISGGKVIIKDTGNKSSATGIDAAGVLEIGGTADVSFENCNYDIKSANNDNKISGGKVTLSGSDRGLSVTGNFAMIGGEVESSGDGYSLYGSDGTINLSGGSLNLSSSDYPIVAFKKCIIDFAGAEVTAESTKGNCALVIYDSESSYKVSDGEVILKSTQAGANKMYVSLAEGYGVFAGSGEKNAKIVGAPVLNTFTTNKYVRIAKTQKYTLTLVNVKEGTSASVYGGAAIAYSAKDAESGKHFSHWELTIANKTTNVGTDVRYAGTMPDSDAVLTAVYENCYSDKWQNDAENHWKECMVCHQKIENAVHSFGDWQTVKPATTTEKGEQKRSCTVCDYAEYQEIPMLPSGKYTLTLVNVKEGTTAEFSAGAELSYTAQDAESGQHFLHWELTVNNQTDEVGTNPKYTGTMPASNATLTAVYENCSGGEWKSDAENHWKECTVCGQKLESESHYFGDWMIDTPSTEKGQKRRSCGTCHYTEYQDIPMKTKADEQFNLSPGGKYWFDLSSIDIPGDVNEELPEKTLHYVPFTYVGTINAYKLPSKMVSTSEYAEQNKYDHSLFVADYVVKQNMSWNNLNNKNLIFGQDYSSGGLDYIMRAPSMGSDNTYPFDDQLGLPENNEWDVISDKGNQNLHDNVNGYIKNFSNRLSFGQDTALDAAEEIPVRGLNSIRVWNSINAESADSQTGYRPVLELPANLSADSLKVVMVNLGRAFMPGENWNYINIVVKKGSSFTAPAAAGVPRPKGISEDAPLWWIGDDGNYYAPGEEVPETVTQLVAFWRGYGLYLDNGSIQTEMTPDNFRDILNDGTVSFTMPTGESYDSLGESERLTEDDVLEMWKTGKIERHHTSFPNMKLKNAKLKAVTMDREYWWTTEPFFITLNGDNTIEKLGNGQGLPSRVHIIGDGSLNINNKLRVSQYTQFCGGSVTVTGGIQAYYLSVGDGSLTVKDDVQAVKLDKELGSLYLGENVKLYLGSSEQDAVETSLPTLSSEMQELYERILSDSSNLTSEEQKALYHAITERQKAIAELFENKAYARIANTYDVVYHSGVYGTGDSITDTKFYNDDISLRGASFTRTGFRQIGWAASENGEKVYNLKDVYTENKALTLYPVWEEKDDFLVQFNTDGGTAISDKSNVKWTDKVLEDVSNPTRDGYEFTDWKYDNIDVTAETTYADLAADDAVMAITLTAQWKDTEKPTGSISNGACTWHTFTDSITDELFYKDAQSISIDASDNSGSVKAEYYVTEEMLSEEQLESTVWTEYTGTFSMDADGQYIVYAKLTDNSDNVTYLCSNRMTIDSVLPIVKGIEDGKTYCSAQAFTVEEKHLQAVLIDNDPISPNAEGAYEITAKGAPQTISVYDKAGNIVEMTVTINDGHTGGKANCREKAVCEICGEPYGDIDPSNHVDLVKVDAKKATTAEEGNKEFWHCENCGRYFSDADAKNEIKKEDTVIPKLKADTENKTPTKTPTETPTKTLTKTPEKTPDKTPAKTTTQKSTSKSNSPKTGDAYNRCIWLVLLGISGGVIAGKTVTVRKRRRKR